MTPKGAVSTHMIRIGRILSYSAGLALASLTLGGRSAEAQVYSTQQGMAMGSPQAYQPMSCYCPFPQGYCPFPGGYCGLPACSPMGSPQGSTPSGQMTAPYSYQGYSSKPYPTPTFYTPRPIGIPAGSMPTSQDGVWPNSQVASAKK